MAAHLTVPRNLGKRSVLTADTCYEALRDKLSPAEGMRVEEMVSPWNKRYLKEPSLQESLSRSTSHTKPRRGSPWHLQGGTGSWPSQSRLPVKEIWYLRVFISELVFFVLKTCPIFSLVSLAVRRITNQMPHSELYEWKHMYFKSFGLAHNYPDKPFSELEGMSFK